MGEWDRRGPANGGPHHGNRERETPRALPLSLSLSLEDLCRVFSPFAAKRGIVVGIVVVVEGGGGRVGRKEAEGRKCPSL